MNSDRPITRVYRDPLDALWLAVAKGIGFEVVRSEQVYASTRGDGVLIIGAESTLDPDDCLAQMILHELCHAAVQGPAAMKSPDWGLDNTSDRDVAREHACLIVQAHLLAQHGLRRLLAPTTDFRSFYEALPTDPLTSRNTSALTLAKEALLRVERAPFDPHIQRGLVVTAQIARVVHSVIDTPDLEGQTLWQDFNPTLAPKSP